jgi:DNA invertase Pin-like site-specific DNA recombinase
VAYTRVSTTEQANSDAGLGAQRSAIRAAAKSRGWEIAAWLEDGGISGSTLDRPGLTEALAMLERGEAGTLVVAKLDRLSRSLVDFASLMERGSRNGWALVALDLGVDTTSPAGEMLANVLASFAQYERRLIGQRTRDALAVKKAEGVKLGRPRTLDPTTVDRILELRGAGLSLERIADLLTADGVPTAQGGARWYGATVSKVIQTYGDD